MRYPILLAVTIIVLLAGSVYAETVPSLTIHVYKDGKALADATVELWSNGTMKYRGITDANGSVIFTNVSSGEYKVYVYHNGTAWEFTRTIDVNTTTITLNITTDSNDNTTTGTWITAITDNRMLMYTGIGVLLIVLLLLAYAYSGKKIPHRR